MAQRHPSNYISMPKPAERRPGLFFAVGFFYGLIAFMLLPALVVFGVFVIIDGPLARQLSVGDVLIGLFFVALVEFSAAMAIYFLAQSLNALAMFWRTVRATDDTPIGTFASYGRYLELLPYPTTRWSKFWTQVQEGGWMRWRTLVAILGLVLIPFAAVLFPLRSAASVFIPLALVLLGVAVYFAIAQLRLPPSKRRPTGVAADLAYEKGLAYRQRKHAADLAAVRKAGLAAGPRTPEFDLWVHAEIKEAFADDPDAMLAIRGGDLAALDGPVAAVLAATQGLIAESPLRALVADAAVFRRKKRAPVQEP